MNQFQKMAAQEEVRCDICGEIMLPMWGGGWENDRMCCTDRECGAEIVFPTSTPIDKEDEQCAS